MSSKPCTINAVWLLVANELCLVAPLKEDIKLCFKSRKVSRSCIIELPYVTTDGGPHQEQLLLLDTLQSQEQT